MKKILAVDDMPVIINSVKASLEGHYSVFGVTSGSMALKYLNSNNVDLIILDIEMPEMDGFSLRDNIKKLSNCAETPILYLTSNTSVENIKKAVSGSAADFICKPVKSDALLARINSMIGR